MKKVYLNTLTPEEVIKRLKDGEVVKCEYSTSLHYMIDNVIIRKHEDVYTIGCDFTVNSSDDYYFEEEEKFEIKETGLYKTRDGRKAFVYDIKDNDDVFPIRYVIEGDPDTYTCRINGEPYINGFSEPTDIVAKWDGK